MEQVKQVTRILQVLAKDGLLQHFQGNCVLASDVIQHMLDAEGIRSRLVEVTLLVSRQQENGGRATSLVGYNITPPGDSVDTHVVVITEGEQPLLVDASIGHILRNPQMVVIVPVSDIEPDVLCRHQDLNTELVYRIKKNIRLPAIHQKDLITRIKAENDLRTRVNTLYRVVLIIVVFAVVNFSMNLAQSIALYWKEHPITQEAK